MRIEFSYHGPDGTECRGLLTAEDALCGPLCLYLHEGELCLTFAAGTCQAGGVSALLIKQEIDAIVKFEHRFGHGQPLEELLAEFVNWASRGKGDLSAVLRGLLADYLG
jgi:hypothetical protein